MVKFEELNTLNPITWCGGCGDFSMLLCLKKAIVELNLEKEEVLCVSGIGCSGKVPYWINTYGFCGLHGRPLPVATAAKLTNHKLTVLAMGGDGDGYAEGTSHFIHAARRNIDITYIVHDNQVYGLTKGQASPTSDKGFLTTSTPNGVLEMAINPIALALSAGATFVARSYAGMQQHLIEMIKEAVKHKGFAFIDVLQPCVTYNYKNTYQWYQAKVYDLQKEKHNTSSLTKAFEKALEWDDHEKTKIPIGIFYQAGRDTFEEDHGQIKKLPLVKQEINKIDITPLLKQLQ
ncbi:2-oxoacid:ferredoxin oxidoreductase subunit beta [Candidatus Woesearchaeota archaeon]|nr:2-oxoacid:ferredoxin oxidoreductase subunit beta [Candidatus Woesearchaeota archaeon]